MLITKGLIIDEPWISKIINGGKDWEMRSRSSRIRGPIGLIRKGSLQIVGVANMTNVSGPYDNEALIDNTEHHTIPSEMFDEPDYKWRHAWELADIKPLAEPVRYVHKNGAVIWVELDDEAVDGIARQLNGESTSSYLAEETAVKIETVVTLENTATHKTLKIELVQMKQEQVEEPTEPKQRDGLILVPEAKDGSKFSPETCNNKGIYTVGDKGDENKFRNFHEALDYLKTMPKARWRRPNKNGNYGIVAAVDWVYL